MALGSGGRRAFSHLADVYESYSSSALACQSLCRNISVGAMVRAAFNPRSRTGQLTRPAIWPQTLFATPLYEDFPRPAGRGVEYSYALAGTMLAGVGLLLGIVPFILFRYGERLRRRSKIASAIWAAEPEQGQVADSPVVSDRSIEQAEIEAEGRSTSKARGV